MNIKCNFGIRKFFKFLFPLILVVFISYCNTSNKVASNFEKRKYTPGHFYAPTAKINMNYMPDSPDSVSGSLSSSGASNIKYNTLPTSSSSGVTPKASKHAAPAFIIAAEHKLGIKELTNNNLPANNNISSLNQHSTIKEEQPPYEHSHDYGNHSSKASTFLAGWLICLGVSILCWFLLIAWAESAASSPSGGSGPSFEGSGCAIIMLGTFAGIASIVLFILWIVAISSGS